MKGGEGLARTDTTKKRRKLKKAAKGGTPPFIVFGELCLQRAYGSGARSRMEDGWQEYSYSGGGEVPERVFLHAPCCKGLSKTNGDEKIWHARDK